MNLVNLFVKIEQDNVSLSIFIHLGINSYRIAPNFRGTIFS